MRLGEPGATNLSIGLHTAYQDSTPVVAFIGQVERGHRGKEGFQEIDLAEYFSHIVKWTTELNDPSRVPELVHRAFQIARSGRPGPVLISLPQDVLSEVAEMQFSRLKVHAFPRPDKLAVKQAKELLLSAERPVIIAGGGITSRRASKELVEFAELLSIPVATAFRRFDAFPNNNKHYVGRLGFGVPNYLTDLIDGADVVLAIGTRFSQVTTQNYSLLNPSSKLIHIDISADELNKVYPCELGIVADSKSFLDDFLAECRGDKLESGDRSYAQKAREQFEEWVTPKPKYTEKFVNLEGLLYDLKKYLVNDSTITTDAGNFFGWLSRYYEFNQENTHVGSTSGAMGYGLPAAIGAKLARPDKLAVSFSGDGGFMMTVQEIETAVRYQIPIISIVINNNIYGTIRMHQEIHFPNRIVGTELSNPDFSQLAELMGGHGELVESNDEFIPALERSIASNKPAVIEVRTNPENITVTKTITEIVNNK